MWHLHVCSDDQRKTPENRVLVLLYIVLDISALHRLWVISEVGWESHGFGQ